VLTVAAASTTHVGGSGQAGRVISLDRLLDDYASGSPESLERLSTGFGPLDDIAGGLVPGQV
jgi:hypothetical protein